MCISIVIPYYKGKAYLADAIASCNAQSKRADEIILVDDCSPDFPELPESLLQNCSLVRHESNRGVAEAFNSGFNAARGKYLIRLAQDDMLKPNALAELSVFLDEHPDIAMVYGNMEIVSENGTVVGAFETGDPVEVLNTSARIGLCWMFRREIWDAGFRFNPAYDQVEDFEFWLRASKAFKVGKYEGPPLLQFRQHDEMGTRRHAARMEVLSARLLAARAKSHVLRNSLLADGYLDASWTSRKNGNRKQAAAWAIQAWRHRPLSLKCVRNILGVLLNR